MSEIRDATGKLIGLWDKDPNVKAEDFTTLVFSVLHEDEIAIALMEGRYERVPNTVNGDGGVFLMFGGAKVPDSLRSKPSPPPPAARQFAVQDSRELPPGTVRCVKCSSLIQMSSGRIEEDTGAETTRVLFTCPQCKVGLRIWLDSKQVKQFIGSSTPKKKSWWQS